MGDRRAYLFWFRWLKASGAGGGSLWRRPLAIMLACCLFALLAVTTGDVAAVPARQEIITSHGYAVFGKLKYPAGFRHLDYVNPDAPSGGTYRYAQGGSFDSLNMFSLLGIAPFGVRLAYDQLMERSLDEPASHYGVLAETISYPRDFSWVEFKLRPQARWHDGRPVTPEDVIFTIEQFKGVVPPMYRRIGSAVARVEKTGPHSVRFYLVQKGNPTLPAAVAVMPVLPRHYYAGREFNRASLDLPLGSGPYRVGKFNAGRWIEFERVKDYWGKDLPFKRGLHNFDIVRHDFYRDLGMLNEAFLVGRVDLRFEGSSARWQSQNRLPAFVSGDIRRDMIPYDNGVFYSALTMNSRRPFLSDRRVRKAITLAYDFEWVRRVILNGRHGRVRSYFANTEFAAEGLPSAGERALLEPFRASLPPALFTHAPELPKGGTRAHQRANLLEAAALLRAAGYHIVGGKLVDPGTGRPIMLTLLAYSPLIDFQTTLMTRNLQRLGIGISFRTFDTAQFRQRVRAFDFDLVVNIPSFPPQMTPGLEIIQQWSSAAADTPGSQNMIGVKLPVVDAALRSITEAKDRQTVIDGMRALDRVLQWNYYTIPFQHTYPAPIGQIPITYWNKFGRPPSEPTYNFPFLTMDHWWYDSAKAARLSHGVYK